MTGAGSIEGNENVRPGRSAARWWVLAAVGALAVLLALASSRQADAGRGVTCSSFGSKFVRTFNTTAARQGNPERMLAACCGAAKAGLNPCHIIVTLVGTHSTGCEFVHLNGQGKVVGPGRHESCS